MGLSTLRLTHAVATGGAGPTASRRTTRLLTAGIVAGPLFFTVWALQASTRDGFDPTRHPISLLSLGDLGWIQVANFVLTGALVVACAVGLRRALQTGRGAVWGPRLIGSFGAGLIVAGIFVADAGAGYPVGAPAGAPEMSWHGVLHEMGYALALLSWTAACLVFGARFAALGRRVWARSCVAIAMIAFLVGTSPYPESLSVRIVLATAVQFAFVAVVAAHHQQALRSAVHAGTQPR